MRNVGGKSVKTTVRPSSWRGLAGFSNRKTSKDPDRVSAGCLPLQMSSLGSFSKSLKNTDSKEQRQLGLQSNRVTNTELPSLSVPVTVEKP